MVIQLFYSGFYTFSGPSPMIGRPPYGVSSPRHASGCYDNVGLLIIGVEPLKSTSPSQIVVLFYWWEFPYDNFKVTNIYFCAFYLFALFAVAYFSEFSSTNKQY
jgi:hypothetical protein